MNFGGFIANLDVIFFIGAGVFAAWLGWSLKSRRVNALWFLMWIDFVVWEVDRDLNPFGYWFGMTILGIVIVGLVVLGFML